MRTTDTLVIGAGQAGLALSRLLTERGRDHVVLERGHIGRRWSQETWDSLHLLTPNWANGLPGSPYAGPDPDGFMSAIEFAGRLGEYARSFDAPVDEEVEVESVRRDGDEFSVVTTAGAWRAGNVVIATGWCDRPAVPSIASGAGHHLEQIAPSSYRNPGDLAPVACWSSAPRRPASSSPRSCAPTAAASCWRSAGTAVSHVATGAWTSSGGSSASVRSTERSTR